MTEVTFQEVTFPEMTEIGAEELENISAATKGNGLSNCKFIPGGVHCEGPYGGTIWF